jgi:hypothetical protein
LNGVFCLSNVINLVVRLSVRRGPGVFMNVAIRNMLLSKTKFVDVAKFITLISLPSLISCELSFPIVGLKHLPCLLSHWNNLTKFSYRT